MNNNNAYRIKQYILLTRPYSIMDVGLVGLLGYILSITSNPQIIDIDIIITSINISFISILYWVGFNWLNESIQKDKGRIKIPYIAPILIFIFTTLWYIIIFGFSIYIIFLLISFILYAHKHKYPFFTRYIYFLRGFNVLLLFLLFLNSNGNHEYTLDTIIIIFLLFFTQSYRSFIGDFRDIEYDKYTFMKFYSIYTSKIFLFILGVLSILFGFMLSNFIGLSVLVYISFFTIIYIYIENKNMGIESYKLHQHSIVFTFLIKVLLILTYNNTLEFANFLIFYIIFSILIAIWKSYGKVIRPINMTKEVEPNDSFI